jgi:hypothetical protein
MGERRLMTMESDTAMMIAFEAARPAMFGIAYRMLGTHSDAEDVLQDVFLRWSGVDQSMIRNATAWLITACTRRSIDMLRSVARARTDYVGPWLPEPLAGEAINEPRDLSLALETAFLILLERTSPGNGPHSCCTRFSAWRTPRSGRYSEQAKRRAASSPLAPARTWHARTSVRASIPLASASSSPRSRTP